MDDPGVRRPDIGLARRLLRWEPRVSWAEGLAATVAWFRDLDADQANGARDDGTVAAYGGV